jgi:hypothetical protein
MALNFHISRANSEKGGSMETITVISDLFKYNTGYLAKHLNSIDKSRLFIRPEGRQNPIIWILGHIVASRASLLGVLGEEPALDNLQYYFASGTFPLNDPSEYPHYDELMGQLGKLGTSLVRLINQGGENLLSTQVWGDYENIGKYLVNGYIHETYHVGQITYLLNLTGGLASMKAKLSTGARKKKTSTGKTGIFSISGLKSVLTVR